jgi:ribosomal protein S18 acetylase RimI-like enzyme
MITIRSYKAADSPALAAYFNDLNPVETVTAPRLDSRLSAWSETWVVCVDDEPVGYARAAPLPGLPRLYDLDVMVGREWQRKRLGSQLVDFLKRELVNTEVTNLSWGVTDAQSGLAEFLFHNGFEIEHEEQILARPSLDNLPLPLGKSTLTIKTFSRKKTIRLFCRLYEKAFNGHPWYQPYSPDEVAADLISARDILFLFDGERPFGTAWLHIDEQGEGKIEPIGIVPAGQGMGNGRFLFLTALHELKRRGAHRAIIGAWTTNTAALNLYHSLGFQKSQTIIYYNYSFIDTL